MIAVEIEQAKGRERACDSSCVKNVGIGGTNLSFEHGEEAVGLQKHGEVDVTGTRRQLCCPGPAETNLGSGKHFVIHISGASVRVFHNEQGGMGQRNKVECDYCMTRMLAKYLRSRRRKCLGPMSNAVCDGFVLCHYTGGVFERCAAESRQCHLDGGFFKSLNIRTKVAHAPWNTYVSSHYHFPAVFRRR